MNRLSKTSITTIALIALATITAFNTIATLATTGIATPFPGSSLFQITAQYSYGASPNGAVILPGDNVNLTLTIRNNAHAPTNIAISYNATNLSSWTFNQQNSIGSGCHTTFQLYTMSINGQGPISPIGTPNDGCTILSATITLTPGTNTITGNIAVSNIATIGDSFSLNWFGQPL